MIRDTKCNTQNMMKLYYNTFSFMFINFLLYEYSDTPLHHAARVGQEEVIELLLDNGADVHVTNMWGYVK